MAQVAYKSHNTDTERAIRVIEQELSRIESGISASDLLKGATSTGDGTEGITPAALKGQQTYFLRGDGKWAAPEYFSLSVASSTTLGGVKINGNNLSIDGNGLLSATNSYLSTVTRPTGTNNLLFTLSDSTTVTLNSVLGSNAFNSTPIPTTYVSALSNEDSVGEGLVASSSGSIYRLKGGDNITVSQEGNESDTWVEIDCDINTSNYLPTNTARWANIKTFDTDAFVDTHSAGAGDSLILDHDNSNVTLTTGTVTLADTTVYNAIRLNAPDNNNYITGISGDGDSTITITRQGLTDITHNLAHSHSEYITGNELIDFTGDVTGSGTTSVELTIGADKVNTTHIDWGTGTNQVNTDDIPEGTTNLWASNETIDDRVNALIQDGTGIAFMYDDNANTLTANVTLSGLTTDDLTDTGATNKYFTNALARASLSASTPITYNSSTGAFSVSDHAITLAKVQEIATNSFLGRNDASTGDIEVLSINDVETMLGLNNFIESASIHSLTDTAITETGTPAEIPDEDLLIYDRTGSKWKNRKLVESDIPTLAKSKISTSGTWANGDISEGSVTQHQSALSITESQISDFGTYDNYSSWTVDAYYNSSSNTTTIDSGNTVQFKAGTGASISHSATASQMTIEYALDLGSVYLGNFADVKSGNNTLGTSASNVGKFLRVSAQGTSPETYYWDAKALVASDIPDISATIITSGTLPDARIQASGVTQHEGSIDHDALTGFVADEHIDWTTDQGSTNIHSGNYANTSQATEFYIRDSVPTTYTIGHEKYIKFTSSGSNSPAQPTLSGSGTDASPYILLTQYKTYASATTSSGGLMSSGDKTKLDGIETGATNVTNNNQLTNGAGYISGITGQVIGSLNDVVISSTPSNNQILKYNTASSAWIVADNNPTMGNISTLSDVTVTSPSDAQVLQWQDATSRWVNATLSLDEITSKGNYVWTASSNPRDFPLGVSTSFVRSSMGWQDFGSVLNVRGYNSTQDGGVGQIYIPYSSTYGGSSMQYRMGQYNNAGWTSWKTILDSSNYSSYALPLSGGTLTGSLTLETSSNSDSPTIALKNNGAGTYQPRIDYYANDNTSGSGLLIARISAGFVGGSSWGNARLSFGVGSGASEKMYIDGNGRVIIGTDIHSNGTGLTVGAGASGGNVIGRTTTSHHNWFPYTDGNNYYSAPTHYFRSSDHNTTFLTLNSSSATFSGSLYLNDTNTQLSEGGGNSLKITTANGYVEIGPHNSSWAHILTDRGRFYFNKGITVNEGLIGSYDENLQIQTSGTTRLTLDNSTGTATFSGDIRTSTSTNYANLRGALGGLEVQTNRDGAVGIVGKDANGFCFQVYGEYSSGDYGFLDAHWGDWDIKKTKNGAFEVDEGSGLQRVLNAGNYSSYALPLSGGTVTGTLGIDHAHWKQGSQYISTDPRWNSYAGNANNGNLHIWSTKSDGSTYGQVGLALYDGTNYQYLTTQNNTNHLFHNNNKIWTAGNDGSGSGLDADLLDGSHISSLWGDMGNDTRFDYTLKFQPNSNNFAGFQFLNQAGDSAGYFLIRSDTDALPTYSANGITLVADAGHLNLVQRTSSSHGIRFVTGTSGGSHFERLFINNSGTMFKHNGNFYMGADTNGGYLVDEGTYSMAVRKVKFISFNWNANYDNPANHGITSTNDSGTYTDSMSINSYDDINLRVDSNSNDTASYVRFHNNTTTSNQFWYAGYTGSAYIQWCHGEIRAGNDVTAYYSDARLKDFHGVIENPLDKVMKLNGYYFTENEKAKELGYTNDKMQVGVSAQEVQEVLPELIKSAPLNEVNGTDYMTIDYAKLTPLLIEAIKEQQEQINQLKRKIGEA